MDIFLNHNFFFSFFGFLQSIAKLEKGFYSDTNMEFWSTYTSFSIFLKMNSSTSEIFRLVKQCSPAVLKRVLCVCMCVCVSVIDACVIDLWLFFRKDMNINIRYCEIFQMSPLVVTEVSVITDENEAFHYHILPLNFQ